MTNRPLKVGETIKRALTHLIKEDILEPELENISVIISEVKMTPDLKSAIVYMLPMIGSSINTIEFLSLMNHNSIKIRKLLCKKVYLRYAPELIFRIDETFNYAAKINQLINN